MDDECYRDEMDQNQFEEEQVYINEDDLPKVLIESVHRRVSQNEADDAVELDNYLGFDQ